MAEWEIHSMHPLTHSPIHFQWRTYIMSEKLTRRDFFTRMKGAPILVPAAVGLTTAGLWVPDAKASEGVDRLFFFAHGTSVQVEFPERVTYMRRAGWGTVARQAAGAENWFHFAVPTPRQINDHSFTCNRIWLDAKVDQLTMIDGVHVYDSTFLMKRFDHLSYVGRDQWYSFDPEPFEVVALGVSVYVKWIGAGEVLFRNAGGWFECPAC
jgi:hypothetical protein